jgi:hypothetical protein
VTSPTEAVAQRRSRMTGEGHRTPAARPAAERRSNQLPGAREQRQAGTALGRGECGSESRPLRAAPLLPTQTPGAAAGQTRAGSPFSAGPAKRPAKDYAPLVGNELRDVSHPEEPLRPSDRETSALRSAGSKPLSCSVPALNPRCNSSPKRERRSDSRSHRTALPKPIPAAAPLPERSDSYGLPEEPTPDPPALGLGARAV